MPTLAVRELVYCTDEKALYIGTAAGNVKLCDADLESAVNTINNSMNGKLTASPVAAQAALATDANTSAIVTAVNNLIAAMKASGVMNN